MDFLLNPNVAYLLLTAGLFFTILAMLSPGTGILEILGLIMLILAGYSIYNLPINWWALLVLLVGFVLFFLAIRRPKNIAYLAASIAALVIGSAFLLVAAGCKPLPGSGCFTLFGRLLLGGDPQDP
jgi:membrane-bound serine protease (ClpP class)